MHTVRDHFLGIWPMAMKDKSREAWDRLYSTHGLQYGGRGDIRLLEPILKPGMIVLDAGCGDGKTTELLAKNCVVVGCDFSKKALCSLRGQRQPTDALNLVECNLVSLPFDCEKFDVVSCVHALSHAMSEDRTKVARELSRVLKIEGHLFVEVFGRHDIRYGEGEMVEEASYMRGNGIVTHYFNEGEVSKLFNELETMSEISQVRRVSLGAVAGKRQTLRILLRRTRS